MDAQGEDVVAGIRTPHPIADLKEEMPEVYDELVRIYKLLENHYKDMQDVGLPFKQVSYICSRPGPESAPQPLQYAWLWKW